MNNTTAPGALDPMPKRLAVMTVGILRHRAGDPAVQEFFDRVPDVYAAAEGSEGFIARWDPSLDPAEHAWGTLQVPRCYAGAEGGGQFPSSQSPSTLSLWVDLESVAAYAYHGAHGEVLSKRGEWFRAHGLPSYVAWWVDQDHVPDWTEAVERLDHLHEKGPTAVAFDLGSPFNAAGEPCKLTAGDVKRRSARNAGLPSRAGS